MPERWKPCNAILTIEGRGPVPCWNPPAPGGEGRCEKHAQELRRGASSERPQASPLPAESTPPEPR